MKISNSTEYMLQAFFETTRVVCLTKISSCFLKMWLAISMYKEVAILVTNIVKLHVKHPTILYICGTFKKNSQTVIRIKY